MKGTSGNRHWTLTTLGRVTLSRRGRYGVVYLFLEEVFRVPVGDTHTKDYEVKEGQPGILDCPVPVAVFLETWLDCYNEASPHLLEHFLGDTEVIVTDSVGDEDMSSPDLMVQSVHRLFHNGHDSDGMHLEILSIPGVTRTRVI